jgi:hypothetical protein
VDLYGMLGYLSGLYLIKPDLEPSVLLRTAFFVHLLDAALCFLIAGQSGRSRTAWTSCGFFLGIWALGTLFLLPRKRPAPGQEMSLTGRKPQGG